MHIYVCFDISLDKRIYVCTCTCSCIYICVYAQRLIYIYIYTHTHMYNIHIYIIIYITTIHTHIRISATHIDTYGQIMSNCRCHEDDRGRLHYGSIRVGLFHPGTKARCMMMIPGVHASDSFQGIFHIFSMCIN